MNEAKRTVWVWVGSILKVAWSLGIGGEQKRPRSLLVGRLVSPPVTANHHPFPRPTAADLPSNFPSFALLDLH
jgi:hypothetical protein